MYDPHCVVPLRSPIHALHPWIEFEQICDTASPNRRHTQVGGLKMRGYKTSCRV